MNTEFRKHSVLVAVGALTATNLLMVGVMSVTPVHLVEHGTPAAAVGLVVAAHVAAMFGPSPWTGRLSDRVGPGPTVVAGLLMLALVGGFSALFDAATVSQTTVELVLLGFGWNLGLVGGSALLARAAPSDGRAHLEAIGEVGMGSGAAVSAPMAAVALTSGLGFLWLTEYLTAAAACAAFIALTAKSEGKQCFR